jgi:hypothetical protein
MRKKVMYLLFIIILGYLLVKHSTKITRVINTFMSNTIKGIQTFQGEEFSNHE